MSYKEQANNLAMLIESYSSEILLFSLFMFVIYSYFRYKKKNMIWIADIYLFFTVVFIIGIVIAPHRYYAWAHCVIGIFR